VLGWKKFMLGGWRAPVVCCGELSIADHTGMTGIGIGADVFGRQPRFSTSQTRPFAFRRPDTRKYLTWDQADFNGKPE
jgi:hypothetical protein